MKPGIALAMIVRNAEPTLRRCLDSVQGVVAGLAIVDTGSEDRTVEIVRSYGAEPSQIQWPDAFDEARNESLKLVEHEWILWLDADEWLSAEVGPRIKQAITRGDAFCLNLLRVEKGTADEARTELPRLWRSRPFVPFVGVVHEHLDKEALAAAGETRCEFTTDIEFFHDGYAGGLAQGKLERDVPLLREELRRRPGQIYYEAKLACTLAALHAPGAQTALAELADRLVSEGDEDEQDVVVATAAGPLLESVRDSELRSPRTEALVRSLRGWFPDSPGVAWHAAQLEVRRGDLQAALRALLDLERMAETGVFDKRASYPAPVLGLALWNNLAIVAHKLGRREVARRNYERVLAAQPNNAAVREALNRM